MTPRERAGAVWDRFNLDKFTIGRETVSVKEIIDAYERAIIAAVEEERERCAAIVRWKSSEYTSRTGWVISEFVTAEEEIRARRKGSAK